MGTWDVGPFDNDAAIDLLHDIRAGRFDFEQFRFECAGDELIDAEDAAVIVALSALVTSTPRELPDGVTPGDVSPLTTKEARDWLDQHFDLILDESVSAIYSIWEETGELDAWCAATRAVRPSRDFATNDS